MKKILLCVLLSCVSPFSLADEVNFYKNITTFNNRSNGSFIGINLFVDGDYIDIGGFGDLNQFTHKIRANSENATGNLRLRVFLNKELNGTDCHVEAPLTLPLKVENKDIKLPTNTYKITDNISFSDERCRALGIRSFEVTLSQYGSEYRIQAIRG